jgi:hypothetical protein
LREQRDDDYVKYKEEIKRLKTKLPVAKGAIKPCSHVPKIAGLRSKLVGKNSEIQRLVTRLDKAIAAAAPKPCGHELELEALKREVASKAMKIQNQKNMLAQYNRLTSAHGVQPVTTDSIGKSDEPDTGFGLGNQGDHTVSASQQSVVSSQDRKGEKRGTAAAEGKASS